MLACGFCVSRKCGTRGGEWDNLEGAVHMGAARLCCTKAMVGTNSLPGYSNILSLLRGFVSGREGFWTLRGCLPTKSADYFMLVYELAWLRSRVCYLSLIVYFGSVLELELRQK